MRGVPRRLPSLIALTAASACAASQPPSPPDAPAPSIATLRIGTTGDYAPFSERRPEGWFGIDIDLGRDLATTLGCEPRFVATTWPTLTADLGAGGFDIAMSGITVTEARRELASFSAPYYRGGKQGVVRCRERERFSTLADASGPGVVVMVNPGGTNEAFVREHVASTNVVVHGDNLEIFEELERGRADVMFTDAIEAEHQIAARPSLCIGFSDEVWAPFEIAVMAPREDPLLPEIDAWLERRRADGTLARVFEAHRAGGSAQSPSRSRHGTPSRYSSTSDG